MPNVPLMLRIANVTAQKACVGGISPNARKKGEGLRNFLGLLVGHEREL